jgi:hypothetical protein
MFNKKEWTKEYSKTDEFKKKQIKRRNTEKYITQQKEYTEKRRQKKLAERKSIICQVCGKEFLTNRKNQKYCSKECYKQSEPVKINGKSKIKHKDGIWICPICGKNFKGKGKQIFCSRECYYESDNYNNYLLGRKEDESVIEYQKNYMKTYSKTDDYKVSKKKYRQSEKGKNWEKEYFNVPLNKAIKTLRNSTRSCFKRKGLRKIKHTEELLKCTMKFGKKWIENQFDDNMNWENYGTYWQIDHYVPLDFAKTKKEAEKLCNYKNLRPLKKEDNLSKGSKLPQDLNEKLEELDWWDGRNII